MTIKIMDLLKADLQNTGLLADLLKEERTQLEQRRFADLPVLMRRKADLLASLEKNGAARQTLLESSGFTPDTQGMQAFCEAADRERQQQGRQDKALASHATAFGELQKRLEQCRDMNLVNAAIVHRSKLNTGKLLNILKGRQDVAGLYTQLGAPNAVDGDSRILGNA